MKKWQALQASKHTPPPTPSFPYPSSDLSWEGRWIITRYLFTVIKWKGQTKSLDNHGCIPDLYYIELEYVIT